MRKPKSRPSAGTQSTDQRSTSPARIDGALSSASTSPASGKTPASHALSRRRSFGSSASSSAPAKGNRAISAGISAVRRSSAAG